MRRREFTALLGAAMSWCWVARAQRPVMPVVGILRTVLPALPAGYEDPVKAGFFERLTASGYVEGKNVAIDYRSAEGRYDRLAGLAADLVSHQVAAIVAVAQPAAMAAKRATSTIPIVFWVGDDPTRYGLAASFNHPGGNATGISVIDVGLTAKRLQQLHELVPGASLLGLLVNPGNQNAAIQSKEAKEAARALGRPIEILQAGTEPEVQAVFASLAEHHVGGLIAGSDSVFFNARWQIVALAAQHAVPVIYNWREFVEAGGLVSYGPSLRASLRQIGLYTGKILDGAEPADLPIMQPTNFELIINLKTAKALGLTIPPLILGRADEVIE
jgi:putative ABC transport system substrate-binding protein